MASRLRAMKHEIDSINASVHQLRNTAGAAQAQQVAPPTDDVATASAETPQGEGKTEVEAGSDSESNNHASIVHSIMSRAQARIEAEVEAERARLGLRKRRTVLTAPAAFSEGNVLELAATAREAAPAWPKGGGMFPKLLARRRVVNM